MAKGRSDGSSAFDRVKAAAASPFTLRENEIVVTTVPHEPDLWQIVVLGAIDPRQHTPNWYGLIGSIADEERDLANKNITGVLPPPQSGIPAQVQFDAGEFAIICVPDKWTIQTTQDAKRNRIVEVTALVFSVLKEITVAAYGINRLGHVTVNGGSAKKIIAKRLLESHLAFPDAGDNEGQLVGYVGHERSFDTNIQLVPSSLSDRRLNFFYNRHHPIPPKTGYFDLDKLIIADAPVDWKSASEYGSNLAACVNGEKE